MRVTDEQLRAAIVTSMTVDMGQDIRQDLALDLEEARYELEEIKADFRKVVSEPCGAGDEHHCSCVPALRAEIERLKLSAIDAQLATEEVERLQAEIADARAAIASISHHVHGPQCKAILALLKSGYDMLRKDANVDPDDPEYDTDAQPAKWMREARAILK